MTGVRFKPTAGINGEYTKGAIFYQRTGTGGTGNLIFANNSSTGTDEVTTAHARMVILNNGNVGIGTTSPSLPLHVVGAGRITSYLQIDDYIRVGGNYLQLVNNPGTEAIPTNYFYQGAINSTSKQYAFAIHDAFWVTRNAWIDGTLSSKSSWQKANENFFKNAHTLAVNINALNDISIVKYTTEEEINNEDMNNIKIVQTDDIGIRPESLKAIFPELVMTDNSGDVFINYAKLSVVLLDAVNQQQKVLLSQQAKIESIDKLEADNANLKARLERIEQLLLER